MYCHLRITFKQSDIHKFTPNSAARLDRKDDDDLGDN